MSKMKKLTSLVVFILICGSIALAQTEREMQQQMQRQQMQQQTDVSDDELKQFAGVYQRMQVINQQSQQKMIKTVEQNGLTVDRFNELQQAVQNPEQEASASPEETEKMEKTRQELGAIQTESQQKMQEVIEEEGLSQERYQEISVAIQTNPEVEQRLIKHMEPAR